MNLNIILRFGATLVCAMALSNWASGDDNIKRGITSQTGVYFVNDLYVDGTFTKSNSGSTKTKKIEGGNPTKIFYVEFSEDSKKLTMNSVKSDGSLIEPINLIKKSDGSYVSVIDHLFEGNGNIVTITLSALNSTGLIREDLVERFSKGVLVDKKICFGKITLHSLCG